MKKEQAGSSRWSLLGGGFVSTIDQSVVSGCNFLTTVATGRSVGVEGLGAYALASSIVMTASVLQTALLCKPYTNLFHTTESPKEYAGGLLVLAGSLALCSSLFMSLAAWSLSSTIPVKLAAALLAAAGALPFVLLREFVRQHLFAHFEIGSAFVLDSSWTTLQLGGVAWLYFTGRLTPSSAFIVIGLAAALAAAISYQRLRHRFKTSAQGARQAWRRSWRFGSWTAASELCLQARTHLTHWLLLAAQGLSAAGALAAAFSLVRVANPLLLSLANVGEPHLAFAFREGGVPRVSRLAVRMSFGAVLLVSPVCFVAAWQAPLLIRTLFGGSVAVDGAVVALLLAAVVIGVAGYPLSASFFAMERPQLTFWIRAIALLAGGIAAIMLTSRLSTLGAALSLLLASVLTLCMRMALFMRETGDGSTGGSHD